MFPNKGKDGALSGAIFDLAVEKGLSINELRVEVGRLDELFREITLSDTADVNFLIIHRPNPTFETMIERDSLT